MLALGGVTAVSGVLAACSRPGEAAVLSRTPTPTATRADVEQWYHAYGEAGTREAVERYAAGYRDAKVAVTWGGDGYDRDVAAALGTDSGPDVFEYGNGPTIDMITDGQVVDLTDLLGEARDDFQASLLGRMTWDGKVWGIPQVVDTQLLVYRRSMLEAARLEPPRTMRELLSAAKELTRGRVKGLYLGNDAGASIMGGPALWSAGLDYLTDDGGFGFDDPRAAKAFTGLRNLVEAEVLLLDADKGWHDASAIVSGRAAMQWTGLWTFPVLQKALGDDLGVLPWPALDDRGNASVPVGAFGSSVSARARDVAAAKMFVKWLWVDMTAHQLDFATAYGFHIPARMSLIRQAATLSEGAAAEAAGLVLEFGQSQNPMLWTPKSSATFTDMMNRILKDGSDPRAEIRELKPLVESELRRVRG